MSKYNMKIQLISDLCISDGGVYNSSLDTDVCYDKFGFPFIPAKRLKGCLRECAQELTDWGDHIDISKLFGDKGNQRGAVRLHDAFLRDYDVLKREIEGNEKHVIYHPQHVLEQYTYIRTQTAVDYDSGVALDNSLRTMRVIKKGLVFNSVVELQEEELLQDFAKCCKLLKHMGIARTRGLGEVSCRLDLNPINTETIESVCELVHEADTLWYTISLEEPVILKSTNGGESKTLDYIEGNKIMGIIAERMKLNDKDEFTDILDKGNLVFSNAYITHMGNRLTEVPGNFFSIKNNNTEFVNKIYEAGNEDITLGKQLNSMKHTYVGFDAEERLITKDVCVENRYHHRRPDDKSIGRAADDASGDSNFYQMSSIKSGQKFSGFIAGNPDQIDTVYRILSENKEAYIGYSRSSEYGKVEIECTKSEILENIDWKQIRRFSVKLESPTIIYGKNAMYSVDTDDLLSEILCYLGIDKDVIDKKQTVFYLKYEDIGGYNVTWNARKPMITAFDKGTVVDIVLKEDIDFSAPKVFFIGERCMEGYGEVTIEPYSTNGKYLGLIADGFKDINMETIDIQKYPLARNVGYELFRTYVKLISAEIANNKKYELKKACAPTVSNMITMMNDITDFNGVKHAVEQRFGKNLDDKREKYELANSIIGEVEKTYIDYVKSFEDEFMITGYSDQEEFLIKAEYDLLKNTLVAIKYRLRKEAVRKNG